MNNHRIANYLTLAIVAIVFIAGIYFFAWESYYERDMNASGAYVCFVSMISCIVAFSNKNIAFVKKLLLGIGGANILLLLYLWMQEDFCLTSDGLHIFIIMLCMILIYVGFYLWLVKKEKKEAEKQLP